MLKGEPGSVFPKFEKSGLPTNILEDWRSLIFTCWSSSVISSGQKEETNQTAPQLTRGTVMRYNGGITQLFGKINGATSWRDGSAVRSV